MMTDPNTHLTRARCHGWQIATRVKGNEKVSAWIVSRKHIDLLVEAIIRSEVVDTGGLNRDQIGRELWRENYRSVNYRYGERKRAPAYTYADVADFPAGDHADLYLLKQVACYQYQTCERPDWESTKAYRWTQALRGLWEGRYGGDHHSQAAYNTAPWGI